MKKINILGIMAFFGLAATIIILLSDQSTIGQTNEMTVTDRKIALAVVNQEIVNETVKPSIRPEFVAMPTIHPVIGPRMQSCSIGAKVPRLNQADGILFGTGGRGLSCTSSANMEVMLKQDRRFWFDRTLATRSGGGVNFELTAQYRCKGAGGQIVYLEVRSGGKKVQSERVGVAFCG